MAMNVELLRDTFNRVLKENGGKTAFGMRFYERLFEKYPQVKPLFTTPPEDQHKKLVASLGVIVTAVTNTDKLLPYLHAMGVRHLAYKTENGHYAAVGENLLAVMGEHLSVEGEWTDEMQESWGEAVNTVAEIMIKAADHPEEFEAELKAAGYKADGFKHDSDEPWVLEEVTLAR